ncbi:hypothetical protein BD779DRAFT_1683957 [Infundibulicybe gibba]|nr:hypothetical protein BD779DRAFT_1683957 [Infundibulicybe gibba]
MALNVGLPYPSVNTLQAIDNFAELHKSITTAHEALQRLSTFQLTEEERIRVLIQGVEPHLELNDELEHVGTPTLMAETPNAPPGALLTADRSLTSNEATDWVDDGPSIHQQTEPLSVWHTHEPPADRWYAVTVGRSPGVARGTHNLVPNTSGIPGATAQRFPSKKLARAAYHEALEAGQVYFWSYR